MTLSEFLLARIDEDWQRAKDGLIASVYVGWPADVPVPSASAVEEKLRGTAAWGGMNLRFCWHRALIADMGDNKFTGRWLRRQAAPYADHPDYDESWRP